MRIRDDIPQVVDDRTFARLDPVAFLRDLGSQRSGAFTIASVGRLKVRANFRITRSEGTVEPFRYSFNCCLLMPRSCAAAEIDGYCETS